MHRGSNGRREQIDVALRGSSFSCKEFNFCLSIKTMFTNHARWRWAWGIALRQLAVACGPLPYIVHSAAVRDREIALQCCCVALAHVVRWAGACMTANVC